jgi:hypothetical protein
VNIHRESVLFDTTILLKPDSRGTSPAMTALSASCPAFVPGISMMVAPPCKLDRDGRNKSGHDVGGCTWHANSRRRSCDILLDFVAEYDTSQKSRSLEDVTGDG